MRIRREDSCKASANVKEAHGRARRGRKRPYFKGLIRCCGLQHFEPGVASLLYRAR